MSNNNLEELVNRLESVATRLENLPQLTSSINTENSGDMNFICTANNQVTIDFDNLINCEYKLLSDLSNKIGGDVCEQVKLINKALNEEKELLKKATTSSKPIEAELQNHLKPLSDAIKVIVDFREKNRRSAHFNHLSAISEGIPAFCWVAVSPTPCPYIKDMQDASMFYTNRVLKEFKEKDATHAEWTKSWLNLLTQLNSFVKKHFTTGLIWSGKKAAAPAIAKKPTGPSGCGAPPPPPPPPAASSNGQDSGSSHAALFAEINKGSGISSGLRKVTDDQKTHKNPNLRAGNTVSAGELKKNASGASSNKAPDVKPPVTKLEGNKWTIENYTNNKEIVVNDTSLKQSLMIYRCNDCVVTVKGKINSIMMESCKKTAIVFDGLISSLDLVNCQSVQAQTLGVLPIVSIDKTDGAIIYLSKESIGAEIVTAKSSEMNIVIPSDGDDFKELALPEQFKSKLVNGKLVTSCAEDF